MEMKDVIMNDEVEDLALMAVLQEIDGYDEDTRERVYVDKQGWRELSNASFREHFRMDRIIFQKLLVAVGHQLVATGKLQRLRTPLDLCLMMALWPIFNQDTFRTGGSNFGVDRPVVHYHYKKIVQAISELAPKYIKWPSALERIGIKTHFEENYGYPGVVGCMDGVHIEVTAPLEQKQRYVNRHEEHSVLVQAVCDHNLLYRDVYAGEPGSIGDVRMFERSPLSNSLLLRDDMLSRGEHLLADGAYILTDKVLIPYRNRNTTPRQRTHNNILSSARSAVERSFALLKGKNRRHKKLPMRNHLLLLNHIMSGFVLHNFIILEGEEAHGLVPRDAPLAENEEELNRLMEEAKEQGALRREYIAHLLHP